jgi:hypothetical protein
MSNFLHVQRNLNELGLCATVLQKKLSNPSHTQCLLYFEQFVVQLLIMQYVNSKYDDVLLPL